MTGVCTIKTKSGKNLAIVGVKDSVVEVKTEDSQVWTPSYNKIIDSYINRLFNDPKRTGGYTPYEDAIAKYLFDNQGALQIKASAERLKLIQFHPSYSYEDFVRGIVALPNENGDGILYKAQNKVLASFSKAAYTNYLASQQQTEIPTDFHFTTQLQSFVEVVGLEIDKNGFYSIGNDTTAKIVAIVDDGFIYSFDKRREIKYRLLFSDLIKIATYPVPIIRSIDVREIEGALLKMQGKYPYYFRVYNLIKNIKVELPDKAASKVDLKNYVLIIDEINRANLSSVLGELIYALEYRNEAVESIYETDADGNKLVLPPNLYIIGTMNTADRSVGHIDYAIRRRFAFVDVLPEMLASNDEIAFHEPMFRAVSELFVSNLDEYLANPNTVLKPSKYLSLEFRPKDVWLGHSYFLQKKVNEEDGNVRLLPESMMTRIRYEIVPILEEYLKDGVLIKNEAVDKVIANLESLVQ